MILHGRNCGTIKYNVAICMSATHPITAQVARYVEHCVGVADVDDKSIFIKMPISSYDI